MEDAGHSRHFVAVGVHSRNARRQNLVDGGWLNRNDSGQIAVMKLGSEIVLIELREDSVWKRHPWNCGESDRRLRGSRQLSLIQARVLAWWRQRAFHYPIHQSGLQRPKCIAGRIGIRR